MILQSKLWWRKWSALVCHNHNNTVIEGLSHTIYLVGSPNVGKSVVFSKLTGHHVISANYSGTTIDIMSGKLRLGAETWQVIDLPGIYSLDANSEAESVTARALTNDGLIICVLDASHLSRDLQLAFDIQKYQKPIIYLLNLVDVAKRQGITIEEEKLSRLLGAPVIPTVATKNIGIEEIKKTIPHLSYETSQKDKKLGDQSDQTIDDMIQEVENYTPHTPAYLDRVGDLLIKPFPGLIIAVFILLIALAIVVGGGKGLRTLILLPIINDWIIPFITNIVDLVVDQGVIHRLLVGEFGILVKGIEWPFALIFPYVLLFYFVLSFLEDSGYLPRLAILVEGILNKIGLPGQNIVPFIMGYGCAVPAILGTRAATSYKQRLIVTSLISIGVPCTAQTGAFIALLGDQSMLALGFVFGLSILVICIAGSLLNHIIPGDKEPVIIEVPPLLLPDRSAIFKKIAFRLKHFLVEAEIPMMLGILLAALIVETGLINWLGHALEPVIVHWLGLPKEASLTLILGIIRRELAVMPLLDMQLTTLQLITGAVVALFYIPCLSVFIVIVKEFRLKIASYLLIGTTLFAIFIGGLVHQIGQWLP